MDTIPVIIPTLNRYSHLVDCLNSLAECKYASETDIYISVDYPPEEKFFDGYERVLEYVKGGISGFRNVYIYIQEKNLGVSENAHFLYNKAFENNDRLIFTEDDNIFSHNFLEYMIGMMKKYEKDESIYAVTGYRWPFEMEKRAESFKSSFISAWGCGLWKDRVAAFERFRRDELVRYLKNATNRKKFRDWSYHVYKQSVYVACEKHHMQIYRRDTLEKTYRDADFIVEMYMYIRGMQVVVPYVSKVRNMGHDGSGENCDIDNFSVYSEQKIDDRDYFEDDAVAVDLNENELKQLRHFHENNDDTGIKERIKINLMLAWGM